MSLKDQVAYFKHTMKYQAIPLCSKAHALLEQ